MNHYVVHWRSRNGLWYASIDHVSAINIHRARAAVHHLLAQSRPGIRYPIRYWVQRADQ